MKYIFNCDPEDFILAGRSIKSALNDSSFTDWTVIQWENGDVFYVKRNKNSITVTKSPCTTNRT